jgi:21S rRNA (uridine2791-2'-O)-methyltransferase
VVVDLGYAPGSWSQVAVERTRPGGLVLGIDVIPAAPPRGVSTIQGNFLSENVREMARRAVGEMMSQRETKKDAGKGNDGSGAVGEEQDGSAKPTGVEDGQQIAVEDRPSYIDLERLATSAEQAEAIDASEDGSATSEEATEKSERLVDVSSLCTPGIAHSQIIS